jgi:hypothetical protein
MSATLIRTCPLCGLRFDNLPILELHIARITADGAAGLHRTTAIRPVRAARPARLETADPARFLRPCAASSPSRCA